jgi:hypothetical protein
MYKRTVVLAGLMFVLGVGVASSQSFRQLLKVGGAVAVADRLGPQIDSTLNKVTRQRDLGETMDTKIVPVLSVGQRKHIGIVQVAGPKAAVDQTRAVAQFETRVPLIGGSRARILIPINTRSVTDMKRVSGVGVSSMIDMRL